MGANDRAVGPELWLAPLVWSRMEMASDDGSGFPLTDEGAVPVLSTLKLARDRAMAALIAGVLQSDELARQTGGSPLLDLGRDSPEEVRALVPVYVIDFALSSLCRRAPDSPEVQALCRLPNEGEVHFRDLADAVSDEFARLLATDELNPRQYLFDRLETKAREIGETLGWSRSTALDLHQKLSIDLKLMLLKLDMARGLRFWDIDFHAMSGYEYIADGICFAEAKAIKRALTQMSRRSYTFYVDNRVALEWDGVCRNPYWSWMDKTVLWHLYPIVFGDPCRGPDAVVEAAIRETAGGMMSSVSDDGKADEMVAAWLAALWSDGAGADTGSIAIVYDRSIEGAASKCPS